MNNFPTEILLKVFVNLPAQQLIKCKEVCLRWNEIIKELEKSEDLWENYVKTDFRNVFENSQIHKRPRLLWFNIYKSLSLWPKLATASETVNEFAGASWRHKEIKNFKILSDSTIGVHTHSAIKYYDIGTWELSKQEFVNGEFLSYFENDHILTTLDFQLKLHVTYKTPTLPRNHFIIIENVKTFLIRNCTVYYVNLNDDVFVCDGNNRNSNRCFIERCNDGVLSLGYSNNCLNVLTFNRNIYSLKGQRLFLEYSLDTNCNLLQKLREYNLLEHLDWRIYFQWMYILNHSVPEGPLRDIVTVRSHGDILLVGSNWGVLRIFYAPSLTSADFNIYDAEPMKQYNFMDRPILSMCPIIQIDVLENENGHTILVAMPKKIAIIDLTHI